MDPTTRLDFQLNKLGYTFKNVDLLQEALTHSLDPHLENPHFPNQNRTFDRLQVIGSSVLKMVTAKYVMQTSDINADQGVLTKKREALLSVEETQTEIGKNLFPVVNGKWAYVRVKSEKTTLRNEYNMFVKALMGAVFLDAGGSSGKGLKEAEKLFLKLWKPFLSGKKTDLDSCFPAPSQPIQDFWKKKRIVYHAVELRKHLKKYYFKRIELLCEAITQKTIYDLIRNNPIEGPLRQPDYQRLEFFGDSVLEVIMAEYLHNAFPNSSKEILKLQLDRVTGEELQLRIADELDLKSFVRMKPDLLWSNYHDIVESIIGAIYVDSRSLYTVKEILFKIWKKYLPENKPQFTELESLQSKLGYKFTNETFLKESLIHESADRKSLPTYHISWFTEGGRQVLNMYLAEYIIGTGNTVECYKTLKTQCNDLISKPVLKKLAKFLELEKCVVLSKEMKKQGSFREYEKFVLPVIAAVHVDKLKTTTRPMTDHTARDVFYRLWNTCLNRCPRKILLESFPPTPSTKAYRKFRAKLGDPLSDGSVAKIEKCIGHMFQNRHLLEQALTSGLYLHVGNSIKFGFIAEKLVEYFTCLLPREKDIPSKMWLSLPGDDDWLLHTGIFNYAFLKKYYAIPDGQEISNEEIGLGILGAVFVDLGGFDNLEAFWNYYCQQLRNLSNSTNSGKKKARSSIGPSSNEQIKISVPETEMEEIAARIERVKLNPSSARLPVPTQTRHFAKRIINFQRAPVGFKFPFTYWIEIDKDGKGKVVHPPTDDENGKYEFDCIYTGTLNSSEGRPENLEKLKKKKKKKKTQ